MFTCVPGFSVLDPGSSPTVVKTTKKYTLPDVPVGDRIASENHRSKHKFLNLKHRSIDDFKDKMKTTTINTSD